VIVPAKPEEARAILGAMRRVASTGGRTALSAADRATLAAAARYVFKDQGELEVDRLPDVLPADLSRALGKRELIEHAVRFLAVMALVDGRLDQDKIALVLAYAAALRVEEHYVRQLAEAGLGHLQWVARDMMRQNIKSIAGLKWDPKNVIGTFVPYSGTGADLELNRKYESLGTLPQGSFGRAFFAHYQKNGYPLPGLKNALNESFATPHDSTHVLSGYDTSPHGELLVSTFTAAMHKKEPMSGHVLPVIFSWHLGIQLNEVAKSATGAFDPEGFWRAWDRGSVIDVDTFGPRWSFWDVVRTPVSELRERYAIPALEPGIDATLALLKT
jgi:hypothetical protein